LLIEDDPALPQLIKAMLRDGTARFRFKVDHADRLSHGLERLTESDFDVVLLDLGLPDSDGMHAVTVLRTEMPHVPVVVLTGLNDEDMAISTLRAGAQDYLVKGNVESRLLAHTLWSALERHRLMEELRLLSLLDDLTGLHNRRGFEVLAAHHLRLANRYEKNLLLICADIVDLRSINERLGHHEGDRALVETATALKLNFRTCDILARCGGDEFAVLTSECSPAYAEMMVDRLMANVSRRQDCAGLRFELSITAGSAPYDPTHALPLADLMRQADEDMYRRREALVGA